MKKFVFLPIAIAVLSACSSIQPMRVQVRRPAQITVAPNIQTVAVLNRSIPSSKQTVETVLTAEKPKQDEELSNECIRGLNNLLETSDRFKVRYCKETMMASDPTSLRFGELLDWAIVDSLCKANESEALLVLEYFDTDFKVVNPGATAAATVGTILNGNTQQIEVTGTAKTTAGFRVYVPATKTILYEDHFSWSTTWRQSSTNPIDALSKLIKPNQALMETSYNTGYEFGGSIIPLYYWEDRSLYKGKKDLMAKGERQALAKDWEGAVITWKEVYDDATKSKIKAKAAFNLALGYEVLGDLETAQKWIQTAYVEGGEDEALRYSEILDLRVREQEKLKLQTGE